LIWKREELPKKQIEFTPEEEQTMRALFTNEETYESYESYTLPFLAHPNWKKFQLNRIFTEDESREWLNQRGISYENDLIWKPVTQY
jgi:hypothetical protein